LRLAPEVVAARKLRCCDIIIKSTSYVLCGIGQFFYHAPLRKQREFVTIQVGTPRRGVQGRSATPGRLGEASLPEPT
jgi:hypothetical protein